MDGQKSAEGIVGEEQFAEGPNMEDGNRTTVLDASR
jgi:hypothetical protein